jgi:transcriptional regulator of acetoin/glycerol metabolism
MDTEQPPTETVTAMALLDLMLSRRLRAHLFVPELVTLLKDHGYSMRQIARESGIPRTTLHRWAETTA